MKKPLRIASILTLTLLISGCVSPTSHVLVGTQRPPISPDQVKIYLHPPTHYEEVAIVSSNSLRAFMSTSAQKGMDVAMRRLKEDAAKLGANGIILNAISDQSAGSVGYGFGSATATGGTAYGTSAGFATSIGIKAAQGVAIYVTQE